jgi:tetratricopeptide (TPR) repeat protein
LIHPTNSSGAARPARRAAFAGRHLRLGLGTAAWIAVSTLSLFRCTPAKSPGDVSGRAPLAQKWLERAKASYATVDLDDASDALKSALEAAPNDVEVRTWAGRVALARLDYAETLRLLQGVATTEARGLRGRAEWYAGDIDQAADELESMLQDPEAHDGWAKAIAGLARRGAGRKPFQQSGGIIAVAEMPRLPTASSLLVPIEIDGDQALAMVATGTAEVTLDSAARKEPSWVSIRFGGKIEVKDVPAMVQDLSAISRQMNVPIKALLGVNLLRHLNATFDYIGGQFIVRNFAPPIPANASRVPVAYIKGGGMVMRSGFSSDKTSPPATLLLDTAMAFPLALDEDGWKKAGTDLAKLKPVGQDSKLKQGVVPVVRLGTFDIPQVPAVYGTPIGDVEKNLDLPLDGVVGCGLLAAFRVTITDQGRSLWFEEVPVYQQQESAEPPSKAPSEAIPPASRPVSPAPSSSALPPPDAKGGPQKPPAKKAPSAPRPAE